MKYKLQVYSIWEYGSRKDSQGNPHQEDSMFPPFGQECPQDRTFILCDGMGGHGSGEVASATVCEAMSASILKDGHDPQGEFDDEDLAAAITAAYAMLDAKDTHEAKSMGTTMTFLKLHNDGATIAHIGDSRVYQIRPGKTGEDTRIMYQTHDHSLINDLIKIGELTPEQARHSNRKNVITRSMMPGADSRHKADVWHTRDIKPGDYFYMCSDGMLEQDDMDNGTELRNIFSEQGGTDEQRVEALRAATVNNRDNHTAFIIHILEVIDPLPVGVVETPHVLQIDQPAFVQNGQGDDGRAIVEPAMDTMRPPRLSPGMAEEVNNKRRNVDAYRNGARTQNMQKQMLQKYRRIIIFLIIAIVAVIGLSFYLFFNGDSSKDTEPEVREVILKPDNDTISGKPDNHAKEEANLSDQLKKTKDELDGKEEKDEKEPKDEPKEEKEEKDQTNPKDEPGSIKIDMGGNNILSKKPAESSVTTKFPTRQ